MKTLLAAGLLATLPLLAACGNDDTSAEDPGTTSTSSASPGSAGTGSYPAFAPEDYTYRLEVLCYCPRLGPAEVTVQDGEVVDAVLTKGGRDAPEFMRLTIDDIIDRANDPEPAAVDVNWPDAQDYPRSVAVDQNERVTDEEITYVIKDVSEG